MKLSTHFALRELVPQGEDSPLVLPKLPWLRHAIQCCPGNWCGWPEIDTEPPFPIIPQTLAMRLASFSMFEEKILPWLLKTS